MGNVTERPWENWGKALGKTSSEADNEFFTVPLMTVRRVPALRMADDISYAFCGHRWNQHGWTPGDDMRTPHCDRCQEDGVEAHVLIYNRQHLRHAPWVDQEVEKRFYEQWDQYSVEWQRNQMEFLKSVWNSDEKILDPSKS